MTLERVRVAWDGGELPAVAAIPEGARRGLVIIHEIMGMQPEIERVVSRCAAQGYAAVAPDFFSSGPRVMCIAKMARASMTGEGDAVKQLRGARDWLSARTGLVENSIGVLGFCIGGQMALAAGPMFGAVSTNYGDVPPTDVMRGTRAVIGCYGGRDKLFGKMGGKLQERVEPLGIPVEAHTFPEVGHSFLTDGDHPVAHTLTRPLMSITWNPQVAEDAWGRIFRFLDGNLRA